MRSIVKIGIIDTYGWVATSSMLICMVSGVFLAIPFNITSPFLSLTILVTANPYGSFVRNLHFWSAQFFLVFTALHIYDHLKKSSEDSITNRRTWLMMVLSVLFLIYAMISGFMLKADADSLQAIRIISSLLDTIPFAGKLLQQTFIGKEGDFQLIYVHHLATASILILIGLYDHVKTIWPKLSTFLYMLLIISVISLVFRAPLYPLDELLLKGPWYFVGIQEMLYVLSHPVYLVLLLLLFTLSFYFLPQFSYLVRKKLKTVYFVSLLLYIMLTLAGYFFRGENWSWEWPWEKAYALKTAFRFRPLYVHTPYKTLTIVQGRAEGCMSCHSGMKGLSEAHNPQEMGCFACHRGDPFTLNKTQAHRGMERVPGNLSNATLTCGANGCHQGIVFRVPRNLMSKLTGMISVDHFVFGESASPDGDKSIGDLAKSASDTHLKNLCVGCHLGNEKLQPGPQSWLERGGGCNACHLTYGKKANSSLLQHPSIDLNITNEHCMSCHSRSGRIATNYEGWHETTLTKDKITGNNQYRILPDNRVFQYISSDIHHQKGMACIDCHGSYELMGDGGFYRHEEEAVSIQCADCHRKKVDRFKDLLQVDRESQLIIGLRNNRRKNQLVILTEKNALPLVNIIPESDSVLLMTTKLSGKSLVMNPPAKACTEGKVHRRLSCQACHTAWVPQCLGCHNSYEKQSKGWDMLANREISGTWVEYAGKYLPDKPVLGFKGNQVYTMMPGMILSIDKGSFEGKTNNIWHRLYAPASGHTTQKYGRSCKSCHNDPLAIGYGRGELKFFTSGNTGQWKFTPRFEANPLDGLPEDAWIPFLKQRIGISSTRLNVRAFNLVEQRKILTVGACLSCHEENSSEMKESLIDFEEVFKNRSVQCVIPSW